jgi:hypothetical protein
MHHLHVEHDDNDRCCRREPWILTMLELMRDAEPHGVTA